MSWQFSYAVEVVAFFVCACQYTFTTIQYQYIYQVVSEEFNFTKNHSVEYCTPNASSDENELSVANEVSRWTLYSMMAGYITCAIGSTVITSWSDSIGRKIGIAFPVIGTLVAATVQCLTIAYRLPLYMLIIVQVVYGISGTYSALLSIGCAYLSDMVKLEDRGRRFNMLEICASLGGGILQIGTGYWVTSSGFVPTSILIACCSAVGVIVIPFMKSEKFPTTEVSETSPLLNDGVDNIKFSADKANESNISKLCSLRKQLKASWNIYTTRRCVCNECIEDFGEDDRHYTNIRKERLWRLWFYVLTFAVYMFAAGGVALFITMFIVSYPVCFTPDLVGAQWGLSNGLVIFVPFFLLFLQGCLKFQGQTVILIGIFARICSCALMSIARGPILVFSAISFAVIYSLTTAFLRSELTRLVSPTEQGAALAVMSGMQNVAGIFSPLVFLTLYPATLHIFHGFSLLVAAMVYAVAFVLMTVVWIANRANQFSQLSCKP